MKTPESSLYPLSPIQHGMLFQALSAPDSGIETGQVIGSLTEEVSVPLFEQAWRRVAVRHDMLRATLCHKNQPQAMLRISGSVDLTFDCKDWRQIPPERQREEFAAFCEQDCRRGFGPDGALATRVMLIQFDAHEFKFVWTFQSALHDGTSLKIILRDVLSVYDASLRGEKPALPPVPRHGDIAPLFAKAVHAASADYWRGLLHGLHEATAIDLPKRDAHRPPHHEHSITLTRETISALNRSAASHGVAIETLVRAAWALLLGRYSREDHVIFGTTHSCREHGGMAAVNAAGLFFNTSPVRADVAPERRLSDLLKSLQEQHAALSEHGQASLSAIQKWSGLASLFHSIVIFEHSTLNHALGSQPGRNFESYERTGLPLALYVYEDPELLLKITANSGYDPSAMARMLGHLATLLEAMPKCLDRPLGQLPMLTTAECSQFADWNQTQRSYSATQCVHELFETAAKRTPERPAVTLGATTLTYGELDARANQLARHLRGRGVTSGSLVGISLDRSCEMVVSMLAVFKAGAAYVPLDPAFPAERITYMIENSGVMLIITQQGIASGLSAGNIFALCLAQEWPEIARESRDDIRLAVPSNAIAYVMHTSGSTGRPKGIAIEHRSVMNFLESMKHEPGIHCDDVLLAVTTISFDISILELFLPLIVGAHVLLVSREEFTDPQRLALHLHSATIMQATPATWRALVEAGWKGSAKLKILCGGEAMAPDIASELLPRCGELWNMYGPTETTVWSTCQRITSTAPPIPVGRPIANTTIHILGKHLQRQPIDVAGELYIGGDGLARGYHHLPALTAEKFIVDPSGDKPAERLYSTGDLARIAPDGTIEVLGRIDRQIKIRGFRIEAGEIEARLNEYPGVRQSTIIAHEYEGGEKAIVAYVAATFPEIPVNRLRAFLMETLPDYMIPSVFVGLQTIPLTPNGKVDVKALPAPDDLRHSLAADFLPPRNKTEEALAAVWCELLHRKIVGVNDNFFDLGGHSLTASTLATRISSIFRVSFPLRAIFEQPTIAGLASLIGGLPQTVGHDLPVMKADPDHACDPFPLSEMQQAYMAGRSSGFDLGNISLHDYIEFEPEQFDLERFNAALQTLIQRHPMLRAVVCGDGMQRVLENVPDYSVATVDLRDQPAEIIAAHISEARGRMSHQIFDLAVWPWFEIRAFRLENTRYRLFISCDALMLDAWSGYLLQRQLASLLSQSDADSPPPSISFRDYVFTDISLRDTDAYRRARDYWAKRLTAIPPPPSLPLAKSPSEVQSPRFVRRSTRLEPSEWMQFKLHATQCGLTPGVALIAAYSEVLARWSQSRRFCLNLPIFNRPPLHPHINDVVGHFTSLSLLAIDLTQPGSFMAHAFAIQQQLWDDLDHRQYGGVQVMRDLARHHGNTGAITAPIVTTNIMLESGFQTTLQGRVAFGITQTPQVLLDQMAAISDGALLVWWDAVAELLPGNVLEEMFAAFCGFISLLAKDKDAWAAGGGSLRLPGRRVDAVNPEPDELLHVLFLNQVHSRWDEPAVISPSRTIGYAELHRRAMHIAQSLRDADVRPNSLVAIVMERGWEQIVAVLGILYSGAAYVPIEAQLPAERLEYLLLHGEVKVVLTQSQTASRIRWPENIRHINVDEEGELSGDFALLPQDPGDLAYVIYTSGSTGKPKGVMIDHRGAVNTVLDVNRRFQVTASDRVLSLSSLSFDLSVYDVFGTLAAGGAIVLPAADSALDPAHWAEMVLRHGVSIWNTVPALMSLFVEYATRQSVTAFAGLRVALLSGDWIPLALPAQIRALSPATEVISLGGATEASIWSILYPIQKIDPAWKSIPYGQPMTNQSFHVLDSALDSCPDWVVGELYIGGIGLAKGYLRDLEKTKASFIAHPDTGERLYKTGDLGRWLPDGNIEFLGRRDFQVKVQGFRIELEEIESVLLKYPGLLSTVVTASGGRHDNKRLVAYVVSQNGPLAPGALRKFLLEKLPAYMVPSTFVNLARLPLSPNGKVDRTALRNVPDAPETAPTNGSDAVTGRITQIVARILRIGHVEPDANLLNLGADSLNLISIVNALDREMHFRPKISDLYRNPTVAALVAGFSEFGPKAPLAKKSEDMELLERIRKMTPEQIRAMLATTKA